LFENVYEFKNVSDRLGRGTSPIAHETPVEVTSCLKNGLS